MVVTVKKLIEFPCTFVTFATKPSRDAFQSVFTTNFMSNNEIFSGSLRSLFNYWQDYERAKKFLEGGTRTDMVHKVVREELDPHHSGYWLDVALGAGFVQSVQKSSFTMRIGLDISWAMLEVNKQEVQKILGSGLIPPFRKGSIEILSSFFCFSDYPNIETILENLFPIISPHGFLLYIDYAKGDEYWETRKQMHSPSLVGNINLRLPHEISALVSKEVLRSEIVSFQVQASPLQSQVPNIQPTIQRKFILLKLTNKDHSSD